MNENSFLRGLLAFAGYWAFFIVVPLAVLFWLLGFSATTLMISVPGLVLLLMVGERGFRLWKELWKVR